MNKEEIKKLLELYEQGLTSSQQEADLLESLRDTKDENHRWFNYLKQNKKSAPKNLESNIWSAIQSQEKKKSRFLLRTISVAASVALIVSILWISKPFKANEMSYAEKEAVLKEARALLNSGNESNDYQHIIYEDESIIIYIEN